MNVYKVIVGFNNYKPEEMCIIAKNVDEVMQLVKGNLGTDGDYWVEEVKLLMWKPDLILQNK